MKAHLSNAAWGILDYAAQPLGMLVAAPILLHSLGLAPYGMWLIASAAVSAGSIVSSGFGDAVIQRIASLRTRNDHKAIRRVVANMLAINLILGCLLATILWLLVPPAARRITHIDPGLLPLCLMSLRIGAVLIVIKSVESVFASAQRGFEAYGPAVRISVATRLLSIAFAIVLALNHHGVVAMMIATSALTILGALAQWTALHRHISAISLWPSIDRATMRSLASFGGFSWLQAVSGVIFSQADRLLLGTTLGAAAVAYYGVCVQVAQPIHGLTAAGLHFLFPHLASRSAAESPATLRRSILAAMAINLAIASLLTGIATIFGPRLITTWMGASIASASTTVLPCIAISFGLLALNATGHYALLAFNRVRLVTAFSVAGGIVMLVVMSLLIPKRGIEGAAFARLLYGPCTLLMYVPLFRSIATRTTPAVATTRIAMEEA